MPQSDSADMVRDMVVRFHVHSPSDSTYTASLIPRTIELATTKGTTNCLKKLRFAKSFAQAWKSRDSESRNTLSITNLGIPNEAIKKGVSMSESIPVISGAT